MTTHTIIPWDTLRQLDASAVADWLQIPRTKRRGAERNKRRCVWCDSSDGLHVYPGAGRGVFCYACGQGGDAASLVAAHLGCTMVEAAEHLAGWAGVPLEQATTHVGADLARARAMRAATRGASSTPADDATTTTTEADAVEDDEQGEAVEVLRAAWASLSLGEQARAYLARRGFNADVARAHRFASVESSTVNALMPPSRRAALERIGWPMVRGFGGRFPREGLLVIPYTDERGAITSLRFRTMEDTRGQRYWSLRDNQATTPFLLHPSLQIAQHAGTLYFCEGELNALALRQIGLAAMSCAGSKTWRAEWLEQWRDVQRVVLLLDDDDAGEAWGARIYDDVGRVLGADWRAERLAAHMLEGGDAADLLARDEEELAETIGVRLPW